MSAVRFVVLLFLMAFPAGWAAEQALLRDFYLTLPAWDETGDPANSAVPAGPQAGAAVRRPGRRPLPALRRPRLEFWGIAPWAWTVATVVLVTGAALGGARLAMFFAMERNAAAETRRRRQARRALQAIADGDRDLDSAAAELARWYGLPASLDGHDLSTALQDLDPAAAMAVTAWEIGRFAPSGTPARVQAGAAWRDFLRQWLRQRRGFPARRAVMLPAAVFMSPEEMAAAWNRLVELPVEVAASHPHRLPAWFSAEVALVTAAVAVVAMLVVCLYWRHWRWRRQLLAILVLVTGMASARLVVCHRQDRSRLHRLAVVVRRVSLRPAPESSLTTGIEVAPGDVVDLAAERKGWRQVRFARATGWVSADAVVCARPGRRPD